MEKLIEVLKQLGISKVKLAKLLGVSRQMVYNYLELEDLNKWPKDKKVIILNLLGIKSPEDLEEIKVDTDYIMRVESRIENLFSENSKSKTDYSGGSAIFTGLGKKQKEIMYNLIEIMREKLDDEYDEQAYKTFLYLYHYLQTINTSPELKYLLAYTSKAAGFTTSKEFVFDEEHQFMFESILFSAMTLYKSGGTSKTKIGRSRSWRRRPSPRPRGPRDRGVRSRPQAARCRRPGGASRSDAGSVGISAWEGAWSGRRRDC